MTTLKVTVLGSGTSTGVPVIGCDCEVCHSPHSENNRTRASLLLNHDSLNIVIDTAPEFRLQMLRARVKTLAAVLYTHIHADHCHGFDDLRMFAFRDKDKSIPCYMHTDFIAPFKQRFSYAFDSHTQYYGTLPQIDLQPLPDKIFTVAGLQVETVRLPHGAVMTNAFRIGKFAYATDFKTFAPELIARWKDKIETMVISGVRFRPHKTHSSVQESVAILQALNVRRGFIGHLSHEVDYHRHRDQLPPGISFSYDGLNFAV